MKKIRLSVAAAAVVLATGVLAGCDGGEDASNSARGSDPKASATAPAEGSQSDPATAQEVFKDLSGRVSGAKLGTVVTAENDPNKLLGRPQQYTSKVTFTDSRIAAADVEGLEKDDSLRGGAIEVFESEGDAKARSEYIQSVTKKMPSLAEYHYQDGPVLVRVSHYLTPKQAADYKAALGR
jgi:hypothetical protein